VTRFTEGYAASVAPLSQALRAFGEPDGDGEDRRWLWLACRLAQGLWADELWHLLATRGGLLLTPCWGEAIRRPRRAGRARRGASGRSQALCSASRRIEMACATAPRVACVPLSGLSIMKSCVMPS
jgi:hypothetical protein